MKNKISQARYYSTSLFDRNTNVTTQGLIDGSAFKYPIVQLGIEANEGTEFYVNNALQTVAIGGSELFELEETNIYSLRFVKASVQNVEEHGGHIIVDYVYQE